MIQTAEESEKDLWEQAELRGSSEFLKISVLQVLQVNYRRADVDWLRPLHHILYTPHPTMHFISASSKGGKS